MFKVRLCRLDGVERTRSTASRKADGQGRKTDQGMREAKYDQKLRAIGRGRQARGFEGVVTVSELMLGPAVVAVAEVPSLTVSENELADLLFDCWPFKSHVDSEPYFG